MYAVMSEKGCHLICLVFNSAQLNPSSINNNTSPYRNRKRFPRKRS